MLFHFVCCGTFGCGAGRKRLDEITDPSALRLAGNASDKDAGGVVIDSRAFKTHGEIEFEWKRHTNWSIPARVRSGNGGFFDGKFSKRKIRFHNTPLLDYDSSVAFRRIPLEQHRCALHVFKSEFELKQEISENHRFFWCSDLKFILRRPTTATKARFDSVFPEQRSR